MNATDFEHAQVEVNFIVRGWAHYRMSGHEITLCQGDLALFWGGLPHQMDKVHWFLA